MHYKPKNVAALHIALAGLPDRMRVEADPDVGVSAKTVGELRNVTAWPDNCAVTTPQQRDPEHPVKVGKASHATRVASRRASHPTTAARAPPGRCRCPYR